MTLKGSTEWNMNLLDIVKPFQNHEFNNDDIYLTLPEQCQAAPDEPKSLSDSGKLWTVLNKFTTMAREYQHISVLTLVNRICS